MTNARIIADSAGEATVLNVTAGTAAASKAVVLDGSKNIATLGTITAASLDISGAIDVDGTTNLDVVDIDGAVNMATTALVTGVLTTTAATVFNGGFASNAASSIGGTTPTLTIGDAGAEDAKIVFDGNAQDYHIGLDDSVDDLIIGKGSALGTTPAITINEDLQTTIANHANPKSAFRNHIINGDFCVWQRTSADTTISDGSNEGYNSADRWQQTFGGAAGGAVVWNRSQDVPAEQGFEYALKISPSTTANCTGSQEVRFSTTLEAQMFPDLSYGTSAAKNMVLSFWFKTNKVGLYSVYFETSGTGTAKRKYLTFTPAQSGTWERIELLVTGDTDTAFPINVNTRGMTIAWYLDNTPNFDSANAESDWTTNVLINSSNNINFMDNTNNELYITGVQFEVANTATDFEYLPFDVVLNRCQRYFYNLSSLGPYVPASSDAYLGAGFYYTSSFIIAMINLPTAMRTEPSLTTSNASNSFMFYRNGEGDNMDDLSLNGSSSAICVTVGNNSDVSGTAGMGGGLVVQSGTICNISAEL